MTSYYNLAGVKIRYDSEDTVKDEATAFFQVPSLVEQDIDLRIIEKRYGKLIIPDEFKMTFELKDMNCFVAPSGELIVQFGLDRVTEHRDGSYRVRFNSDMSCAEVDYTPYLSRDAIFGILGRFIFECHIMNRGWLAMHAVSVDTGAGAILFSGVSGSGKTTQADLWLKYDNCQIINGDRAILIPEDGGFATMGTAWSGTSRIFTNLRAPIKAIVFIEQASKNKIEKLSAMAAFDNIVKHCSIPYYHSGLLNTVCNTIDSIASSIPMYYLKNTADEESYRITKEAVFDKYE